MVSAECRVVVGVDGDLTRPVGHKVFLFALGAGPLGGLVFLAAAGRLGVGQHGVWRPDDFFACFAQAQTEVDVIEGDGVAVGVETAQRPIIGFSDQ